MKGLDSWLIHVLNAHTHMHTCMHTYTCTHTRTHVLNVHTHTHTHTHTHAHRVKTSYHVHGPIVTMAQMSGWVLKIHVVSQYMKSRLLGMLLPWQWWWHLYLGISLSRHTCWDTQSTNWTAIAVADIPLSCCLGWSSLSLSESCHWIKCSSNFTMLY